MQRLRNKGIIVPHPKGMPQIPLENIDAAEKMEKCLASSTAQMEYLVSIYDLVHSRIHFQSRIEDILLQ